MSAPLLEIRDLVRVYTEDGAGVPALQGLTLAVQLGTFPTVMRHVLEELWVGHAVETPVAMEQVEDIEDVELGFQRLACDGDRLSHGGDRAVGPRLAAAVAVEDPSLLAPVPWELRINGHCPSASSH